MHLKTDAFDRYSTLSLTEVFFTIYAPCATLLPISSAKRGKCFEKFKSHFLRKSRIARHSSKNRIFYSLAKTTRLVVSFLDTYWVLTGCETRVFFISWGKRCEQTEKNSEAVWLGVRAVSSSILFPLSYFVRHSTIRTPGTGNVDTDQEE